MRFRPPQTWSRFAYIPLALLVPAMALLGCASQADSAITTTATLVPTSTSTSLTTTTTIVTTTTLSKAQLVLHNMTLREKAAQVLLLSFSGTTLSEKTSEVLKDGPPGGLLIMGGNVADAGQIRSLTASLQETAASTGSPVGLIIAVDQEGGPVQRIRTGAPAIPSARTLGSSSTPAEAASLANSTAAALLNMGVNMNLAPVADVVSDQGSFLYSRTYGSDPTLVSSFVAAVVEAYQDYGLISVLKHFPGHGSGTGNTHSGAVVSDLGKAEFESVHLPPFAAGIGAGVEGVMMSHVIAKAYDADNPASASAALVGGLLREELGFDGVVLTDDLRMAAASSGASSKSTGEARSAVAALKAGCDLLILTEASANQRAVLNAIVAAIEDGTLAQSRLEDAVLRVLALKFRHGILPPRSSGSGTTTTEEEESS